MTSHEFYTYIKNFKDAHLLGGYMNSFLIYWSVFSTLISIIRSKREALNELHRLTEYQQGFYTFEAISSTLSLVKYLVVLNLLPTHQVQKKTSDESSYVLFYLLWLNFGMLCA